MPLIDGDRPAAVTEPSHLAAGPALGHVHQFQVALLELVPFAIASDRGVVCLRDCHGQPC